MLDPLAQLGTRLAGLIRCPRHQQTATAAECAILLSTLCDDDEAQARRLTEQLIAQQPPARWNFAELRAAALRLTGHHTPPPAGIGRNPEFCGVSRAEWEAVGRHQHAGEDFNQTEQRLRNRAATLLRAHPRKYAALIEEHRQRYLQVTGPTGYHSLPPTHLSRQEPLLTKQAEEWASERVYCEILNLKYSGPVDWWTEPMRQEQP